MDNAQALWEGLRDGRISVVATDDCAFSLESKEAGAENFEFCPEGMPGIEPRLTVMYSEGVEKGRITLPQLVELTARFPDEIESSLAHPGYSSHRLPSRWRPSFFFPILLIPSRSSRRQVSTSSPG